ncbi:carboxypeptidase regulatory-like domain-containing protein [Pedobacter sp. D749]|uniref:carboxypeptidase regulatory-like domain-containing protein n=1 Tax=Pedobacter sp. D749 TaxID=2856523 RepID=UPI001C5A2533|nr:carboxypeptidase regulatory-like domain-containing protein [Pedobacter sp. D749]QXU42185.1 carboxypeptidase regulatory-like domain-containing protein [Pedobacter sp. D749]
MNNSALNPLKKPTSGFLKTALTLVMLVFICLQSCKKEKEKITSTGLITGTVLSKNGLPLSGVKISLDNEQRTYVFSDGEGKYTFDRIPVGGYSILAAKEKYLSESKRTTVTQDGTTKLDFHLEVGEATLEIEKDSYQLPYTKTSNLIKIKSNTAWMVTLSTDWLDVDNPIGLGDKGIYVVAEENQADTARTATLTLTAGMAVKVITIIQYPKIKLLSVSMTHPITDTVILTFSAPVSEVQITSKYDLCLSDLAYNRTPMSKEVRFKYSCGRLGQSYPFQVTFKDKIASYTENFNVDFFSKRIAYPAVWSESTPTYFVSDDNKTVWFSIFDTQIVQKIDMETFTVIKNYPVDFKVRKLVYNPYNKLIYLLTNTPDIYVMDPDDGSIVKQIKLEVLDGDNNTYPTIYPQALAFTSSGIGAMVCGARVSSATSWKMIDSRKNDLVYYHKQKDKNYEYGKIEVNYDRTKLIIKAYFSNITFSIDPVQDVIRDITIPVNGSLGGVVPNKKNNNLYMIQTYEQYIHNPANNYLSKITYLAHGNAGDFSYRSGEEEIIYAFDTDNWLQILDYKNGKTLLTFPTINELYYGKPISTTNGRYLVNFGNFTLFRFDTELFTVKGQINKTAVKTAFVK